MTEENVFKLNLQIITGNKIDDPSLEQISRILQSELQEGALIKAESPPEARPRT